MKRLSDLPARDVELLSAYLDQGLSPRQERKLHARLEREPDLRWALDELRRTVAIVRSLPEVHPPRSFTLAPEVAGERRRPAAYPVLQLATALATLAFVAVVGLDTLSSGGSVGALAPSSQEQAQRLAAPQAEATEAAMPAEEIPSLGAAQPEESLQAQGELPAVTPTALPTAVGIGGGEPGVGLPGASEALPTLQPNEAAEDRAFIGPGTPCVGCGAGGGGEGEPGEPPMIAQAPLQGTPAEAPTEAPSGKTEVSPAGTELANAPDTFAQPANAYRPGVPLIRLAEISLGLAAVIMAGLTLWVRRSG
jgi:anti-sigma factor RsiW